MPEHSKHIARLLEAVLAVTGAVGLRAVLREILAAASSLVGARYAALGLLGPDGSLEDFLHVGIDEATVGAIGHLPEGRGVLGLLIDDPRPLRLQDLSAHPSAHGFPPNHPPMKSFLGTPVRRGSQIIGNLYLTEKADGANFDEEDEELAIALAAVAGVAIDSARLYEELHERERWLDAVTEVAGELLAGSSSHEVLLSIASHARSLSGADVSTIALLAGGDLLELRVADGVYAEKLIGTMFAREDSLSAQVMDTGEPLVAGDVMDHAAIRAKRKVEQPGVALDVFGPVMILPLTARGRAFGTLLLAKLRGGEPFGDVDLRLTRALAGHAGLAYDYGSAEERRQTVRLSEDRERIARDLHDSIVRRLFATGMSLEGLRLRLGAEPALISDALHGAVDEIDAIIHDIRTTVFSLQQASEDAQGGR